MDHYTQLKNIVRIVFTSIFPSVLVEGVVIKYIFKFNSIGNFNFNETVWKSDRYEDYSIICTDENIYVSVNKKH